MPTGSCGRFLFGRFATPSARTKPPGRAAQKLVRRPNKRTRQRASERTDLRTALLPLRASRAKSDVVDAAAAAARSRTQLPGARREQHEPTEQHLRNKSASTPSPIQSRRQSRGHEQERTRRRRRAASPQSAPAPARSSASAESARYDKKTSNSALDAPAGCRSTSWQRFSSPQDVRRTSGW